MQIRQRARHTDHDDSDQKTSTRPEPVVVCCPPNAKEAAWTLFANLRSAVKRIAVRIPILIMRCASRPAVRMNPGRLRFRNWSSSFLNRMIRISDFRFPILSRLTAEDTENAEATVFRRHFIFSNSCGVGIHARTTTKLRQSGRCRSERKNRHGSNLRSEAI